MLRLQTATVHEDYAWIYPGDEAIDTDREDWEAELEAALESQDMDRLPLRQGAQPTIFTLRHPTPVMRRYFAGLHGRDEGWSIALRRVVQLSLVKAEHTGMPGLKWAVTDTVTGAPCVPDSTMDVLDNIDSGGLVNAIAARVFEEMNRPN